MSKHRDERLYLNDISDSTEAILTFISDMSYEEFVNDRKTYSATIRELEIIGEAVGKISNKTKAAYPDVLWQHIKAFRNKIAHEYFGVDFRIVWDIVRNELPILYSQISTILKDMTEGDDT